MARPASAKRSPEGQLRIAAVVEDTGVSKELIHHYLRQGLLPQTRARARYDGRQVELLRLIRKLREDHNLPLEAIREIFERFAFDPVRLSLLTRAESLCERLTRFLRSDGLTAGETLDADALAAKARIGGERLAEYLSAGIVAPRGDIGGERYSTYDANTIAVCERGRAMGIPLEWFRTVSSYIRLAFELAHGELFRFERLAEGDVDRLLADLFAREEIALSFVQNVLQALVERRLAAPPQGDPLAPPSLDGIVFAPSASFSQRHGLSARIEAVRKQLARRPGTRRHWLLVARLLLHGGRYREAVFFLERALERWPADLQLRAHLGRALALAGELVAGQQQLAQLGSGPRTPAWVPTFTALAQHAQRRGGEIAQASPREALAQHALVERGLSRVARASASARCEVETFSGWLLCALPAAARDVRRGRELLLGVLERLAGDDHGALAEEERELPGLFARCRANAAYLLFETLRSDEPSPEGKRWPSLEALRSEILSIDPQCAFAERAFLVGELPRAGQERDGRDAS